MLLYMNASIGRAYTGVSSDKNFDEKIGVVIKWVDKLLYTHLSNLPLHMRIG